MTTTKKSGFQTLKDNFNRLPIGSRFQYNEIITPDIKVSKATLLAYRSKMENLGYMERVSVKLNNGIKEKIIFMKLKNIESCITTPYIMKK